jgi:hypothetical protein
LLNGEFLIIIMMWRMKEQIERYFGFSPVAAGCRKLKGKEIEVKEAGQGNCSCQAGFHWQISKFPFSMAAQVEKLMCEKMSVTGRDHMGIHLWPHTPTTPSKKGYVGPDIVIPRKT